MAYKVTLTIPDHYDEALEDATAQQLAFLLADALFEFSYRPSGPGLPCRARPIHYVDWRYPRQHHSDEFRASKEDSTHQRVAWAEALYGADVAFDKADTK